MHLSDISHRNRAHNLSKIVYIRQCDKVRKTKKWQKKEVWRSWVAPTKFLESFAFWDLQRYAEAVVDITPIVANGKETEGFQAKVREGKRLRPKWVHSSCFQSTHTTYGGNLGLSRNNGEVVGGGRPCDEVYGANRSCLGPPHDERLDAVTASSAWTALANSGTRRHRDRRARTALHVK